MLKSEIKTGKDYAYRERCKQNDPLQRVRIIENVRGNKWKVEWIDPNPGLIDYVESRCLVVPWKDHRAYLRDDESKRQLLEDNKRHNFDKESPLDNVLHSVFDSVGEHNLSYDSGVLSGKKDALERIMVRAKLNPDEHIPYSYTNRYGEIHIPFSGALKIAKAFCMNDPQPVLVDIESTERKWSQEALQPGGDYLVNLLNEYRAAWAIIRQWTGTDAAMAQRDEYIKRLERLVWDAIYALQKAGADNEAAKLRRAMERH
jgi:hypothetical protein